ncbi:precorrin-3B synthase [Streptomyces sp. NPDC051907]|uniref:precorrin-3B synthase n=1 Tax=Streptomyces sp. NPDC051907 TaxID=3155284 RepID=UPI003413667E
MPPAASPAPQGDERPIRDGGDACPGALRLHTADDGALARVRIPAGVLAADQAHALADAAERLGDGSLDVTSRGNVQLRGLDDGCGAELARLLDAAGLLPAPRHERVRNIVASPLSGLDGRGHADVQPWARALDRLLCASESATALSGRFLFAFDDGRGDVAALGPDVTILAQPAGQALLLVAGDPKPVRIGANDTARAALLAADAFLAAAGATRAWRVRELPPQARLSAAAVAERLAAHGLDATFPAEPGETPLAPAPPAIPELGIVAGPAGRSLSVLARLGRLTAAQWRTLAAVAAHDGTAELRVTPWRGIVLPGLTAAAAPPRLAELADAGLVTAAHDPWAGVGACTGRPGCAKSLTDVRADACAAVQAATEQPAGVLPVYWSGCERRCGHPQGTDWTDAVATPDGYEISVRRSGHAPAGQSPSLPRGVPTPALADAIAAARTPPVTEQTQ